MSRLSRSLLAGLLLLSSLAIILGLSLWLSSNVVAASNDRIWSELPANTRLAGQRMIIPDSFRLLQADTERLRQVLSNAPAESAAGWRAAPQLDLPLPDGRWMRFAIVSAPIMEDGLAAKFPGFSTYLGRAVEDETITARLDWTQDGFHGLIYTSADWYFIDPYSRGDTSHYLTYSRNEYMTPERQAASDFIKMEPKQGDYIAPPSHTPGRYQSGEVLRTYRLALAATGEYTAFHGGTVAGGMSAIVTSVNRVTGVYEREVAVRMVLIANNDQLVYTDGGSDPYSNSNGPAMLGQNQSNIDAVIGSASYDIGHVFSTGGGGVAQLGVPCRAGEKAQGVTGSPQPVGDAFDIDYVAHEMGHQFGANHTFNGTTGSCGGNRSSNAAYEPGSGSTIMAYAGICGAEDLQPHSDPIFHYKSLAEITNYINNPNGGDSCPVKTNTGNTPPVVNAGADYAIPGRTPFELTGSATDADSDPLTYLWEEYDRGPAAPPNTDADGKARPILRDWVPLDTPTRMVPRLPDLVGNTTSIGEALPTIDRTMVMRLTVRDNRTGGGAYGTDTMNLVVDGDSGPFQVTAPNTAVTWTQWQPQAVTWAVAGTASAPVSCASVDILLSTDGGNNFDSVLLADTANDGSASVTPNAASTEARIKVRCSTSVFFDISNVNFTIDAAAQPNRAFLPFLAN